MCGSFGIKKPLILPLKHVLDPRPSFPLWEGCIRACCSDVWMHAGCVWSSPRRERHGGHSKGPGPSPWPPHPPSHHSHPLRLVPEEIFSLILITPDSGVYFLPAMKLTQAIGLIGLPRVDSMCNQKSNANSLVLLEPGRYSNTIIDSLCQLMKHSHRLYDRYE